ncbi:uncharacterized protein LOC129595772 isoform X2 [Paramacrobiotus metropolitanus]|uniref:uncharacterized protein LOC129595772 isoform X2 n=1 Tax=Paramacrobiotus metropolitanus TaxID=2943436 RepID=UPI0024456493|nr:uncharacterized protein LOC129595772 isoform X2 [Paramacrobiotus metropolitanus]
MWKPQIEKANYSTSSVRVVITDCVENYWFTSTGDALISIVFALTLDDSILNRTINGTMLPAIEPLSLDQMKDKTDGQIANVHIGPVFRGYTLIIRNANVSWLFSLESSEYNTSKVLAPVRDYLLAFLRSSSCTSSRDNGGASAQQIDIQFGYPYPAVVRDMKASRYYQLYGNDIAVAFVITVNNKTYQGPFPFKTINGNGLAGVKLIFAHGDQYRIDPIPTLFWAYLMGSQFATPRYWTPTADYIKKALQQPLNDSTADALRASKISFSVNALMMEPPPYCTDTIQLAVSLHAETSNPNGAFLLNAALPLFAGIQRILYGSQLRDEINHQLVSSIVPRKRLYTDAEMLDLDRCKNADFYTCPNSKRSLVVSVVPINTDHFVVSKDICANEYQRYKFLNAVVYAFNKVNTVVINDAILNVTLTTCTDGLLTSRMYEAVRLEFGLFLEEPKLSWSIFEMPTDAELDAAFYPIRFKVARDPIIDTSSYYDSLNSTLTKG